MKNKTTTMLKSTLFASSMLLVGFTQAQAAEKASSERRLVNLQAEAVREVANDQMKANLYVELNEKDAATLANKLNTTINSAIQLAKKYASVQIQTGNQNTYPVYNDKRQLVNWRGRASIVLSSQDFKQTSELIGQLQGKMQLQGISFDVSEALRNKVESELYVEASKSFQQRAQVLLSPWSASRYELINLHFNSSDQFSQPMYAAADAAVSTFKMARVESQELQAGKSEVRVVASGTIQLQ